MDGGADVAGNRTTGERRLQTGDAANQHDKWDRPSKKKKLSGVEIPNTCEASQFSSNTDYLVLLGSTGGRRLRKSLLSPWRDDIIQALRMCEDRQVEV